MSHSHFISHCFLCLQQKDIINIIIIVVVAVVVVLILYYLNVNIERTYFISLLLFNLILFIKRNTKLMRKPLVPI